MSTNDKNVNIHMIHSMKGGCGKTACSLLMALQLADNTKSNSNASVLFVDADFRGSALQWLLFENPASSASESYHQLLNDFNGNTLIGRGIHHQFALPENYCSSKNLNQYIMGKCQTMKEILLKSFSYEKISEKLPDDSELDPEECPDEGMEKKVSLSYSNRLYINSYIDFIFSSSDFKDKSLKLPTSKIYVNN